MAGIIFGGIVIAVIYTYIAKLYFFTVTVVAADDMCNLKEVDACIGPEAKYANLAARIYANPTNPDLLTDIKNNHCDKSIVNCMELQEGNCSAYTLAPYRTIVDTVTLVCHIGVMETPCITRGDVQQACELCFRVFKVVVDSVVEDHSLKGKDIDRAFCSALADVRSCCMDAAYSACNNRAQAYISTLLSVSTNAYRWALNCNN
ncbi:hypothetical protein ACF0H5_014367 [Mactra antiquata]